MLVDYHVHLEEGPYNRQWLERTLEALNFFEPNPHEASTKEQVAFDCDLLQKRLHKGSYSQYWLDFYLQRAKERGLKEVGIVDHLYRFKETKSYFEKAIQVDVESDLGKLQKRWLEHVMTEEIEHFVDCIEVAKLKWAHEGVQLRIGLEVDFFVGQEQELQQFIQQYDWDFVIGSIHFVDGWGFDNPQTMERFESYDLRELYTCFYESVEKMIQSKLFDFVAHLDNLKVFNQRVEDDAFNQYWYERIAKALVEADVATEINAGLFYRYPVAECCPAPEFLQILVHHQVPITLSSDSHYPDDLGTCINDNLAVLQSLGVKQVATFEKRKRVMASIEGG